MPSGSAGSAQVSWIAIIDRAELVGVGDRARECGLVVGVAMRHQKCGKGIGCCQRKQQNNQKR